MERKSERASGVLLHISSLPSYGGIGDFGPAAFQFADFLAAARQRIWQILPLSPTGYGNSPYSALSAFAGNPLFISLERLVAEGWIAGERLAGLPPAHGSADFDGAWAGKIPLLEEAAANFLDRANDEQRARLQGFCEHNASWLTDFACFTVLRRKFDYACWVNWPEPYAFRKKKALETLLKEETRAIAVEQVIQFFFDEQWRSVRDYCRERDIRIMGDVAIFVNYDSADVWTHPDLFELDSKLRPVRVAGVPPDYFAKEGQRWGNPVYRWKLMQERGFDWWIARIRRSLALCDSIRLDHFRGFEAFWSIPAEEPTAIHGAWVKAPGRELFQTLKKTFGELPFIAEDLGVITPEVEALRLDFGMAGMKVMQFGFSDRGGHIYLPHCCTPKSVIYTGTHDNDTTLGWWRSASEVERTNVQSYLQKITYDGDAVWAMIRAAERSVSDICILPMQDVLFLGSEARMNTPGVGAGNWSWRYAPDALHSDIAAQFAALMAMVDRDGYVPPDVESAT
jgi:4-alpha-glucanotransferase